MKIIKYSICSGGDVLNPVEIQCSADDLDSNIAIAEKEAYNGEYTVEDDGRPDPSETPTQLDAIEAQVTYTAMMTDTLLEV